PAQRAAPAKARTTRRRPDGSTVVWAGRARIESLWRRAPENLARAAMSVPVSDTLGMSAYIRNQGRRRERCWNAAAIRPIRREQIVRQRRHRKWTIKQDETACRR